jgi:hypothetical protein
MYFRRMLGTSIKDFVRTMIGWSVPKVFQNIFSQSFVDGSIYLVETFRSIFTFCSSCSFSSSNSSSGFESICIYKANQHIGRGRCKRQVFPDRVHFLNRAQLLMESRKVMQSHAESRKVTRSHVESCRIMQSHTKSCGVTQIHAESCSHAKSC